MWGPVLQPCTIDTTPGISSSSNEIVEVTRPHEGSQMRQNVRMCSIAASYGSGAARLSLSASPRADLLQTISPDDHPAAAAATPRRSLI